ncbi:hypothetical protein AK830_g4721 [Neonectria ditissima]|uniref:Carrier domain-containing protein n=1 Tax=Neonectria ditissima TaxID=78410 RepID=A0A0P7BKQ6_9HYPO|nr:hypothetical protein AK830_g4721 [Neonectria ditissima]
MAAEAKPDQPGHRLLVNIVDHIAKTDPSRPFIFVPQSSIPSAGWKPITFGQLANAINHVAYEVRTRLSALQKQPQRDQFPTLAYIGPNDARYVIVMLACVKAGHKALFISPRNSLEGQLSLLEATDCHAVWYASQYQSTVQPWLHKRDMQSTEVPSADTWLSSTLPPFPYSKPFEEARWDPLVVLHTSGSTGFPKPITMRQGSFAMADLFPHMPAYNGSYPMGRVWKERATRMFLPMPMFHAAGIALLVTMAIYYEVPVALGIPEKPLSSDLAIECLAHAGVNAAILPPSIIEELSFNEEGVRLSKDLAFLAFAGGNLSRDAGMKLTATGVSLCNLISSTEYFPYPLYYQSDPQLWQYFIISSEIMGAKWRPIEWEKGVYELVVSRKDPQDPGQQTVFYTFPDATEWSTGDLYKAHPTLPDHWIYHGRADNTIVFSNGEKLNPTAMEETIASHPALKGALVVGQDRFQPALLVEPAVLPKDDAETEALIDEIWPLVEEVNKVTVAHGRIVRNFIALANPTKPFLRAPKGTIQRGPTLKVYKDDIDQLYQKAEAEGYRGSFTLDLESEDSLVQSIVDLLTTTFGMQNFGPDTDFFSAGVDSLQVISITKMLRSGLEAAGFDVSPTTVAPRIIYGNPTPRLLSKHLRTILSKDDEADDHDAQEIKAMEQLLAKYTENLPPPSPNKPDPLYEGQTVVITGTTGSLGTYLLAQLCSAKTVKKVIALNRGEDGGQSRQPSINASRGLNIDLSKVDFFGVDLSLPHLGLTESQYAQLLDSTDRIIHSAWPVNFNFSVASFEPYIRGVRNLVDLTSKAAKRAAVVFVSSIGTVDGWTNPSAIPEKRLTDLSLPQMGYGRSKLLGSLILDEAADRSGIPTASVRVGQIAGPRSRQGVWNRQEYLPSLIASSLYLGVLPDSLGVQETVDWLPVEDVAGLILDVTGVNSEVPLSSISGYFHGVNPAKTQWGKVALVLKEYYAGRIHSLVSLEDWVAALEKSAETTTDMGKNPGIKLLDTYRAMRISNSEREEQGRHMNFEMERTTRHSPTVLKAGPVTADLLRNWCDQWGF